MSPDLDTIKQALSDVADGWRARYGVAGLGVFGSRLRGDAGPDSDLDILVRLEDPLRVSLFDLQRMSDELEDRLGVKIDLVVENDLKPAIGQQVRSEVVYV